MVLSELHPYLSMSRGHNREERLMRRWKALWSLDGGVPCDFVFDSASSRVIAEIDFTLKLSSFNEQVPSQYDLVDLGPAGEGKPNGGWTYTKDTLGYPVVKEVGWWRRN